MTESVEVHTSGPAALAEANLRAFDLQQALDQHKIHEINQSAEMQARQAELNEAMATIALLRDRIKRDEGRQNSERGSEAADMLSLEVMVDALKAENVTMRSRLDEAEKIIERLRTASDAEEHKP